MCDTLLEDELGIDGVNETVLFVVGVGTPRKAGSSILDQKRFSPVIG
jgi:hypothetical protein